MNNVHTNPRRARRLRRMVGAIALSAATLSGTVAGVAPADAQSRNVDLGWYGSSAYFAGSYFGFTNYGSDPTPKTSMFNFIAFPRFEFPGSDGSYLVGQKVRYGVGKPGKLTWYSSTWYAKDAPGAFLKIRVPIQPGDLVLIAAPEGAMVADPFDEFRETREDNNVQTRSNGFPWS